MYQTNKLGPYSPPYHREETPPPEPHGDIDLRYCSVVIIISDGFGKLHKFITKYGSYGYESLYVIIFGIKPTGNEPSNASLYESHEIYFVGSLYLG